MAKKKKVNPYRIPATQGVSLFDRHGEIARM
nr:MAG TPA: hypothetical protein [Caudoviricetes sp.]